MIHTICVLRISLTLRKLLNVFFAYVDSRLLLFSWRNLTTIPDFFFFFCCSRAAGDAGSAVSYFEESVEFLSKLPRNDREVITSKPLL